VYLLNKQRNQMALIAMIATRKQSMIKASIKISSFLLMDTLKNGDFMKSLIFGDQLLNSRYLVLHHL